MNSVVYKFSGVYENTVVDENSVVCKSSVKMVDKNSVVTHVDYCTWSKSFLGTHSCI